MLGGVRIGPCSRTHYSPHMAGPQSGKQPGKLRSPEKGHSCQAPVNGAAFDGYAAATPAARPGCACGWPAPGPRLSMYRHGLRSPGLAGGCKAAGAGFTTCGNAVEPADLRAGGGKGGYFGKQNGIPACGNAVGGAVAGATTRGKGYQRADGRPPPKLEAFSARERGLRRSAPE